MFKRWISICVCLALLVAPALGWQEKGHEMSARLAAQALPSDLPPFFRNAVERLVYLCPEPDRWYTLSSPALQRLNAPDHYFDLEAWGVDPIPDNRYDLVMVAVKKGIIHYDPAAPRDRGGAPSQDKYVSDLGTAPYAVSEMAGKLVANFKHWRESTGDTEEARLARHQMEESIIYVAGVLGHYVTDLANPLHCTVHHNGWAEGYPNPRGFAAAGRGQDLHSRFEGAYVNRAISEKDIEPQLSPPHRVGPWVRDMEQFIRRNNGFVEQLYTLEQKGAFGSGREPPEAKQFTAARLADAASMLRDVWHTAWLVSGEEWLSDRVVVYPGLGKTVLQLLRERYRVETAERDGTTEVTAIGNRKNGLDGRTWRLYIDNTPAARPVDRYVPGTDERVDFRFEKPPGAGRAAQPE
jgi:hypothetical protein